MREYSNEIVFHFPSPQLTGEISPKRRNPTQTFVRKPREKRRVNFYTGSEFDSYGSNFEEKNS